MTDKKVITLHEAMSDLGQRLIATIRKQRDVAVQAAKGLRSDLAAERERADKWKKTAQIWQATSDVQAEKLAAAERQIENYRRLLENEKKLTHIIKAQADNLHEQAQVWRINSHELQMRIKSALDELNG